MTSILMRQSSSAPEQTVPLMIEDLSAREREVLSCVAQGLTNDEVACQLGIATGTVKAHLRTIYRKLGVRESGARADASLGT